MGGHLAKQGGNWLVIKLKCTENGQRPTIIFSSVLCMRLQLYTHRCSPPILAHTHVYIFQQNAYSCHLPLLSHNENLSSTCIHVYQESWLDVSRSGCRLNSSSLHLPADHQEPWQSSLLPPPRYQCTRPHPPPPDLASWKRKVVNTCTCTKREATTNPSPTDLVLWYSLSFNIWMWCFLSRSF